MTNSPIPRAPAKLSIESRTIWAQVHTDFVLDDAVRVVLEVALRARDRAAEARALIEKEGLTIETPKGMRQNPA
jgi:hypothetical protein